MRSPFLPLALLTASLLPLTACGSDDGGDNVGPDADPGPACQTPTSERYLPMVVGGSWTYKITDPAMPAEPPREKETTFEAFEDVGDRKAGIMAFRQRSEKIMSTVVSWHEDRCTSVVRHREKSFNASNVNTSDQFYMPYKLRIDETPEHTTPGASWTVSGTEINVDPATGVATTVSKDEMWSVISVTAEVTVPAGTFQNALHIRKQTSGNADKEYWFVKGVGKVKEAGDQLEELTAYTVP